MYLHFKEVDLQFARQRTTKNAINTDDTCKHGDEAVQSTSKRAFRNSIPGKGD